METTAAPGFYLLGLDLVGLRERGGGGEVGSYLQRSSHSDMHMHAYVHSACVHVSKCMLRFRGASTDSSRMLFLCSEC